MTKITATPTGLTSYQSTPDTTGRRQTRHYIGAVQVTFQNSHNSSGLSDHNGVKSAPRKRLYQSIESERHRDENSKALGKNNTVHQPRVKRDLITNLRSGFSFLSLFIECEFQVSSRSTLWSVKGEVPSDPPGQVVLVL